MKADWTTGTSTLATVEALEALIGTLKAGEPTMLFLEHDSGTVLDEVVNLFFPDGKKPGNVEWEADW